MIICPILLEKKNRGKEKGRGSGGGNRRREKNKKNIRRMHFRGRKKKRRTWEKPKLKNIFKYDGKSFGPERRRFTATGN